MFGNDMNQEIDDHPMILAPKFAGHGRLAGVSHPVFLKKAVIFISVIRGVQGKFIYMVMHTRGKYSGLLMAGLWSGQRVTEVGNPVDETELVGDWEWILFDYRIVPGYADEQVSADFQVSEMITLDQGGTINGDASSSWSYSSLVIN
ncbi:MAG: glycoside hydrolase family 43 C-terminal domain-containing protein [Bacteroidia bacterium]